MKIIDVMTEISKEAKISDLHLTIGRPPIVRIDGKLQEWEEEKLTFGMLEEIKEELLNDEQKERLAKQGDLDFSYGIPGVCRFRVNAYYQRGSLAFALRSIPYHIMDIDELNLPEIIKTVSMRGSGLVLVTGPTGSGKSTTLASMIDYINKNRSYHILTLEDPIEYLHKHNESMVHQREIGTDTLTFASAIRVTLRQDPDVILVGELRDLETISLALEAAETGHLVFGTLHTNDAPQSIDRIIDVFPAEQHQQIRVQLSAVIEAIIAQRLVPKIGGGRVASFEIMLGTPAVRNLIREGKTFQIHSTMQLGMKDGMRLMDQDLARLINAGQITVEEALKWVTDQTQLQRNIQKGMGMGQKVNKGMKR